MILANMLLVLELLCAGSACVWHDTSTGVTIPVPPETGRTIDISSTSSGLDFVKKACATQDNTTKFIRDPVSNRRVRNGCYRAGQR